MSELDLDQIENNLRNIFKVLESSSQNGGFQVYSEYLDRVFEEILFLKTALEDSERQRKTEWDNGYKKAKEEILQLFDQQVGNIVAKPVARTRR